MDKVSFTRKELYDLVWSTPMLTLSKRYAISDNGLRKICTRMDIPLPKAGHWQKIQFGKRVTIAPLPSKYFGEQEVTLSPRNEDGDNLTSSYSPANSLTKEIENDLGELLIVPSKLSHPDKLIVQVKDFFANEKPSEYGNFKGVVSSRSGMLDIRVAPKNLGRTLRFMDTLIKVLRSRGHEFRISDNTYVIVEEHEFRILFREKMTKVQVTDNRWNRTEFHPTGILSFQIDNYSAREWKDGKKPIEEQLPSIIAKLELEGRKWKEWRLENKRKEEIRKEKERIDRELQERKEKELSDFKRLLKQAARWRQVTMLRDYIGSIEKMSKISSDISDGKIQWLNWAREKADWYDPFIEREDDLLRNVDRNSLKDY